MERRSFLKKASVGAAAVPVIAAPAIAQTQPAIRWRIISSFPKSLDTIYGAAEVVARRVSAMTGGRFQISVHAAGELVPAGQLLDAVQQGTVEGGHTALSAFFGKDPTWAFGMGMPFGLNARQYNAWWYHLGGDKVFNEFANRAAGVTAILCGNTGGQMAGWFRKEIHSVDDLKGLKFRVGGLAGLVLSRLGVVPQHIAGGDIYSALEKGTIDATDWVGPYDDEKLGFNKVAKYYYTPGMWKGAPGIQMVINSKALAALPPEYKDIFEAACHEGNTYMLSKYDASNAAALKRLLAGGTQLKQFPKPVLDACYKATQETYAELSAKNADFKTLHDHHFGVQPDLIAWSRVVENVYDDYMAGTKRRA